MMAIWGIAALFKFQVYVFLTVTLFTLTLLDRKMASIQLSAPIKKNKKNK